MKLQHGYLQCKCVNLCAIYIYIFLDTVRMESRNPQQKSVGMPWIPARGAQQIFPAEKYVACIWPTGSNKNADCMYNFRLSRCSKSYPVFFFL